MLLLSAENLEKNFGERILFSELSIGLSKGDKAALIAANGTGKTSLMKILVGEDQPENGRVICPQGIRVTYLDQEPKFDRNIPIKEQISLASTRINKIIEAFQSAVDLNSKNHNSNSQRILEEASAAMDIAEGWDYERKLMEMLDRFEIKDLYQKLDTLSGGQKKRLALAIVLLDKPDLMLLDEPTNHLDIDMIEWLEEHLSQAGISFLMVTHDRYFLDNVCNRIYELEDQSLYTHEGNYGLYLKNKESRERAEEAGILKAQAYVRNELDWMRRMPKARTTKSKSRIDSFHETKKKASQVKDKQELQLGVKMSRLGGKILEIKNMSKSYGDIDLIKNFSYNFRKGERIGIIGGNGSGKSTFLNLIAGIIKPDSGETETGDTIVMSYYRQEGLKFKESKKVIEIVTDIAEVIKTKNGSILTASQFLQHFMFSPKVQHGLVSKLSGGERRRLYLLTVLIKNPNFLILDEPTNDLDLITLQKLEDFLLNFGGCLVIVSHDRFFLDKLCDHLLIFEGNTIIKDYYGPYTKYNQEKIQQLAESKQVNKEKRKNLSTNSKPPVKTKKGLSFKEKMEYEGLEQEISDLESEKKDLEIIINQGGVDYQKLQEASERVAELMRIIDTKEVRWLELDELV